MRMLTWGTALAIALAAPALAGPGGHGGGNGGGPGGGPGAGPAGGNGGGKGGGQPTAHGGGGGNGHGGAPAMARGGGHAPAAPHFNAQGGGHAQRAAAQGGGHNRPVARGGAGGGRAQGNRRGIQGKAQHSFTHGPSAHGAQGANQPARAQANQAAGHGQRGIHPGVAAAVGGAAGYAAARQFGGDNHQPDNFPRGNFGGQDNARYFGGGPRPAAIRGCPPGLARKYNGCNPPGLVRWQPSPWRANWWGDEDDGYRYFDGYLMRYSGVQLIGYIPLLGGALFIGEDWPDAYESAPVRRYYSDYYDLGPDYRYYDDTLYRLSPGSRRIDRVAGFLTGDDFVVGERMPDGYDAYNVPWEYRDRYNDGPDGMYRYADGYVYRVDPRTMLILAAIQLLN